MPPGRSCRCETLLRFKRGDGPVVTRDRWVSLSPFTQCPAEFRKCADLPAFSAAIVGGAPRVIAHGGSGMYPGKSTPQMGKQGKDMRSGFTVDVLKGLFREARSYNRWLPEPIPEETIRDLYDLVKYGPTSANCCPARFVFVRSDEGKARLAALVSSANKPKVMEAACTAIVGYDMKFAMSLPKLFPHNPGAQAWFDDDAGLTEATAFRNSSLQGAYLILAARALGLDCGPMSGFDTAGVTAGFFQGTSIVANFLCSLGHGSPEGLFPRLPRLDFEEACQFA